MVAAGVAANAQSVLRGTLTDEQGTAVEFADMVLKNAEGKAIKAGISNEKGEFSFDQLTPDATYVLEASSVGYVSLTIRTGAMDLGELTMPRDIQQLESAGVQAARVGEKAGQFMLVPDPKDVSVSSKGLDLLALQQLPGLRVDKGMKSVTVNGGTPVYKINGKEVPFNRIANLNPESVKRIEYSENAGIRYLDRGASGIINFVLKDSDDGGSFYIDASSAVTTAFRDGNMMGSYHKGKSEIMLSYWYSERDYKKGPAHGVESYLAPDRTVSVVTDEERPLGYISEGLKLEYTYQPSDSAMFVASLSDNLTPHAWNRGHGTTLIEDSALGIGAGASQSYQTTSRRDQSQNAPVLDLYYSRGLRNGQKMEFNVVGQYSRMKGSTLTDYSDPEMGSYFMEVVNGGWALSGEAAYSKQFEKVGLRTGVQYQYNHSRNDYSAQDVISKMDKNNVYGYLQFDGPLGDKVSWAAGTGVKFFAVSEMEDGVVHASGNAAGVGGASASGADVSAKSYVRNLSSAQLNWKISDEWSMTATSSFSPSLPTLSDLSPVLVRSDRYAATQGNPDLRPQSNLNNRIMVRYSSKKGFFANARTGYDHVFSPIVTTYRYSPEMDVFISTPGNADLENRVYAGLETGVKRLFGHIDLTVEGTWKREMSKGSTFRHVNNNFSGYAQANASWEKFSCGAGFTFAPDWTLSGEQLFSSENAQFIWANYKIKNLTLGINWTCPFNKNGFYYCQKGLSDVHSFVFENWTVQNGNMVVLNLTWNLDFGKSFRKGSKTLSNGGYDAGIVG